MLAQQVDESVTKTQPEIIRIGSPHKNNVDVIFSPKAFPTKNDTK